MLVIAVQLTSTFKSHTHAQISKVYYSLALLFLLKKRCLQFYYIIFYRLVGFVVIRVISWHINSFVFDEKRIKFAHKSVKGLVNVQ